MRRVRLAVFLAVIVVGGIGSSPASAHGGEGTLEVIDAVPDPTGTTLTYTVELTYENDGDPVDDAVVSATVRGPGAGPQEPVALASIGDGWYAGPVTFPAPGRWTVAFAAIEPAATLDTTQQVVATPTTSATAAPDPTTTTTTTTSPSGPAGGLVDDGAVDDGPPAGLILGAVVAGAMVVATGIILVLRRRSLGD